MQRRRQVTCTLHNCNIRTHVPYDAQVSAIVMLLGASPARAPWGGGKSSLAKNLPACHPSPESGVSHSFFPLRRAATITCVRTCSNGHRPQERHSFCAELKALVFTACNA